MRRRVISTPIGDVLLGVQSGRLCEVRMLFEMDRIGNEQDSVLDEAQRQIEAYYNGELREFDLPLRMEGTAFERAVWQTLVQIPFGEVRSYGQIAASLGLPKAARAVGRACARNPLLIVVPCHRVIGASGRLTGFAAGIEAKKALLGFEGWTIENGRIQNKQKELPD